MIRKLAAAAVVLVTAAACSSPSPSSAPSPASSTSQGQPVTFSNPVYTKNFPDPGVLRVGETFYAYGTNSQIENIPLLTSTDLVHWTEKGDVLPEVGDWAKAGDTWAPEVLRTDAGKYVMYYTASWRKAYRQCIGTAVADSPEGPFEPAAEPLICQDDEGGSIDADPFRDVDGTLYLYWKNDGNRIGQPTHLYGQKLSADGRSLAGERTRLLTNDKPWQGAVIEAPEMVQHDGKYYLFYSANAYDSDKYAVGYATCDSPMGPCHDAPENPILKSAAGAAGPGHCYPVTLPDGTTWLLYHAWPAAAIGSSTPGRQMWLDRLDWVDGRPVVHGPTADPQPAPKVTG